MRKPVFDIGDTLLPSHDKINEVLHELVPEAPEMDINEYNVYVPEEMNSFLAENDLRGDGEKITSTYLEWKSDYLRENMLPRLKQINQEFGPVGFISDNSLAAKKFYQENFEDAGLRYRGFIVSEELGIRKPDPRIFQAFLDKREETGSNFAYFGNYVERDSGAEQARMKFVWVKQFHTFGSDDWKPSIEKITEDNVRKALEQVSQG